MIGENYFPEASYQKAFKMLAKKNKTDRATFLSLIKHEESYFLTRSALYSYILYLFIFMLFVYVYTIIPINNLTLVLFLITYLLLLRLWHVKYLNKNRERIYKKGWVDFMIGMGKIFDRNITEFELKHHIHQYIENVEIEAETNKFLILMHFLGFKYFK